MDWTLSSVSASAQTLLPAADVIPSSSSQKEMSNIYAVHTWTEFISIHCPLVLSLDRYITPLWYVIGAIGNSLAATVWLQKEVRRSNSSAIYLASLSISDLIFLFLHMLTEFKFAWDIRTYNFPVLCELYFTCFLVVQYLSPVLVLCFTVERWIAVCHPFKKEKYCTSGRAFKVVVFLVVLCMALSSMQSYFWTFNKSSADCAVRAEATAGGRLSLMSVWTWTTEMLIFLVVPLVILAFNVLVIAEVRRLWRTTPWTITSTVSVPATRSLPEQGNSAVTTAMLLSVSFFLIFTTLPATIVYVLAAEFPEGDFFMNDAQISTDRAWQKHFVYLRTRKMVEELCLSHYACNFFFYMLNGQHFRRAVYQTLRCQRQRAKRTSRLSLYRRVDLETGQELQLNTLDS